MPVLSMNRNNFGTTTVLTIPHDGGSVVAGISLYLILGIDEAGILQASKQSRLYLIYFPVFLTAGVPMAIGRIVF